MDMLTLLNVKDSMQRCLGYMIEGQEWIDNEMESPHPSESLLKAHRQHMMEGVRGVERAVKNHPEVFERALKRQNQDGLDRDSYLLVRVMALSFYIKNAG